MKVWVLLAQYAWAGEIVKVFANKPTAEQLHELSFSSEEIIALLIHSKTDIYEIQEVEVT